LRKRTHGLTRFQPDVPQAGEEHFQRADQRVAGVHLVQYQQIDVRTRKQQAMTEATHREQRRCVGFAHVRQPYMRTHHVHRPRTRMRKLGCIRALPKRRCERACIIIQQLPQRPAGIVGHTGQRQCRRQPRRTRNDLGLRLVCLRRRHLKGDHQGPVRSGCCEKSGHGRPFWCWRIASALNHDESQQGSDQGMIAKKRWKVRPRKAVLMLPGYLQPEQRGM